MKPFAKRCLSLFLFLLLSAAVFAAAAFPAAAAGETTTLQHTATGIEVDVAADALPGGGSLTATVGRSLTIGSGGLVDSLDPALYWQVVTVSILSGGTSYTGDATVRIPLVNTSVGTVESVKGIQLPRDPDDPDPLHDVGFSIEGNILTLDLQLPVTLYLGSTASTMVAVPGDTVDAYEPSVWESIGDWFSSVGDWFSNVMRPEDQVFNEFLQFDWTRIHTAFLLPFVDYIYQLIYPFGVLILVIAWAFGVGTSGLTMKLDLKDKYSILRAVLQLLVGIIILSATPQILTLILSIAYGLKEQVVSGMAVQAGHNVILLIFRMKIYLNLAYIALMQCVSPVFVGTAAGGEGARRTAINYFKEYTLRCMELVLTTIYILLVDAIEANFGVFGTLETIVLSLSVFTIDRKFEKLFH